MISAAMEEKLVEKYRDLALRLARKFYITGAEREDVEQEAMFGLLLGLRSYDPAKGPIEPFLVLAIRRWLITCVITGNRLKQAALNESWRMFRDPDSGEWLPVTDFIEDLRADVPEQFDRRAHLALVVDTVGDLSERERGVLSALANGLSYAEAGESLGINGKAVDNARQRVKRKVERRLAA